MQSDRSKNRADSFAERGGLWVLAQALVLLLALVLPVWTGNGEWIPARPVQWAGAVLVLLGLLLAVTGLMTLGEAMTPYPAPRRNAALRTAGVYAWMRHPIYTGMVVGTLGWALWWLSGIGALYTIAVFVFLDRKAAREEVWLVEKYEGYPAYKRRVKKFIPLLY